MQAHDHRSTADNEAAHGIVQPSHWKNTADRLQYVEPRGVGRDGTQPHPAGPGGVLLELLVGGQTDVPFAVKRDGARDRGPLVEGEDAEDTSGSWRAIRMRTQEYTAKRGRNVL